MILPLKKSTYIYSNAVSANGVKLGRPCGRKNSRPINKRPKGQAPPKKKSTRGPGNPVGCAQLTPQVSKQVAQMWLVGVSLGEIAERVGVHKSALARHVERHLIPAFRAALGSEAVRVATLLKEASRISWLRVLEDRTDSDSLRLFTRSIDNLLSISGARAPLRVDVSQEYRVAGRKPAAIEEEMLGRLARRIEDLRSSTAPTVDAVSHETFEEQAQDARTHRES